MADEIVEENYDDPSRTVMTDTNGSRQSLNTISPHKLSSPKISPSLSVIESKEGIVHIISEIKSKDDENSFPATNSPEKKDFTDNNVELVMTTLQRKSRSPCWVRSQDSRKCQPHFREMIGKHETRNEELEQREGNLRERLDMLECSMPAVMVWNILRTTQGASPTTIRRLMEKQFKGIHPTGNIAIPSTPSQHYDCRIREIEAERKEALRRAEEARALLSDKEAAVAERQKLLAEAQKCNQEKIEHMEKLNREATEMRMTMKNARGDDRSLAVCECGEICCKKNLLHNVGSLSSIGSGDLECFAKLQELAESEVCMKRQISDLERREEAYMKTLQEADDLWSKMENDSVGTERDLQEQLKLKTTANQQLADRICQLEDESEKLKRRLIGCKDALEKFTGKEVVDTEIGFEDGEAGVVDRGIGAVIKTTTTFASAAPDTVDVESTAHPETMDEESSIVPESTDEGVSMHIKMNDKDTEAIVSHMDREVDRPTGFGIDASVGDADVNGPRKSNDSEGIPDALKDWNWDEGCPPSTTCTNSDDTNVIQSSTTASKDLSSLEMVEQVVGGHKPENVAEIAHGIEIIRNIDTSPITTEHMNTTAETTPKSKQIIVLREELRNWYNIVDSVHHTITKCVNCSSKNNLTAQLAEKMRDHLSMKALTGGTEPTIDRKSLQSLTYSAKVPSEIPRQLGHEPSKYTSSSPLPSAAAMHLDTESVTLPGDSIVPDLKDDMKLPRGQIETEDILFMSSPVDASPIISKSILDTPKLIEISDEFLETSKSQDTTGGRPDVAAGISPTASLEVTSQAAMTKDVDPLIAKKKDYEEKSPTGQIDTDDISIASASVDASTITVKPIFDTPKSIEISDEFLETTKSQDATGEQPDVVAGISPTASLEGITLAGMTKYVEPLTAEKEDYEEKSPTGQMETDDISIASSPVDAGTITPKSILDTPKPTEVSDDFVERTKSQKDTTVEQSSVRAEILSVASLQVTPQAEITEHLDEKPSNINVNVFDTSEASPELESHSFEASTEVIIGVHVEKEISDIPKEKTSSLVSASPKKSEETISVQQELEVGSEISESRLKISGDIPPLQAKVKRLIIEDEMASEHSGQLKEIASSLIIRRTSPSYEFEVKPETKEPSPLLVDLKDGLQLPSALDLIPALIDVSKSRIQAEVDEALSKNGSLQSGYEGIPEAVVESLPLPSSQELVTAEIPSEKEEEYKQPSVTMLLEDEQREPPLPSTIVAERAMESKKTPEESAVFASGTVSPASITKIPREKIPREKKMIQQSERGKAPADEKPQLPESVDPCICKPPPCYLLSEAVRPEAMKIGPKLDTDATQTMRQFPRTLDRLQLKTTVHSSWPSADPVMRRRPLIWSSRLRDTSKLAMVCVHTQTDSAVARARIPHRGMDRKDDCTCSSVSPKKTAFGGHEHVSNRRMDERLPTPVSLPVARLFGSPKHQSSIDSTMEKESLFPSIRYCDDCGMPVTPEGSPLSIQSSLSTRTTSQKSLKESPKKMATSATSRMGRKKNDFRCCKCKTSHKLRATDGSRKKKALGKHFNQCTCGNEVCCSRPSEDTANMAVTTSKSTRKKRKPEKKDQGVMTHIPTRKMKEKIMIDDSASKHSAKGKPKESSTNCNDSVRVGSNMISSSKVKYSGSFVADCLDRISSTSQSGSKAKTDVQKLVTEVSSPKDPTRCNCGEDSSVHVPYMKYSSIFRANITKDEAACSCGIGKSQKDGLDATYNCSSIESVSKEESSCNCADIT